MLASSNDPARSKSPASEKVRVFPSHRSTHRPAARRLILSTWQAMLNMKAMLLLRTSFKDMEPYKAGHARDYRSVAHGQSIKNSLAIFEGNPPKLNLKRMLEVPSHHSIPPGRYRCRAILALT